MNRECLVPIRGVVRRGHGVASGASDQSPYPVSTIELQRVAFGERGLDLSPYYSGTINVDISPRTFAIGKCRLHFRNVRWTDLHQPEHFSFSPCVLDLNGAVYDGLIYYPHPETKERHFQSDNILEVLAPYIENVSHGKPVTLFLDVGEVTLV